MKPQSVIHAFRGFISPDPTSDIIGLFGLEFQNATLNEAARRLVRNAARGIKTHAMFVNAHCVNVASRDDDYANILRGADLLFADGAGMRIAARLCGTPLRDNVNGTDLFPILCRRAARAGIPLALLGAGPGVAEACADRMRAIHPQLRIPWTHQGFFSEKDAERIVREINLSGARILLVARGVPLQEKWISHYAAQLEPPVIMGVGALFDFYSGAIPRAPLSMRRWGLEWLFRLWLEPGRLFSRYAIGNLSFLLRACRQKSLG